MPKAARNSYAPSGRTSSDLTEQEIRLNLLLQRMHQMVKDANTAADMLEASVGRFAGGITAHYKKVAAVRDDEIKKDMIAAAELIKSRADRFVGQIEEHFNDIIGAKDSEELIGLMADHVAANMSPVIRESAASVLRKLHDRDQLTRLIRKEARELIFEILMPQETMTAGDLSAFAIRGAVGISQVADDQSIEAIAKMVADMAKRERGDSRSSPREKNP